jgi:hypothetical protein
MTNLIQFEFDLKTIEDTLSEVLSLERHFPGLFADALIPINPKHWALFGSGSVFASEMGDLRGKLETPFFNLEVAKMYLESSLSDEEYRDRAWQVVEDTVKINIPCEAESGLGAFSAGAYSNTIADRYMNEQIQTACSISSREELNREIYRQHAINNNIKVNNRIHTGWYRQCMPPSLRGNLMNRPPRGSRPI